MDYIKEQRVNLSITACMMERHQGGQEDALVEIVVETRGLDTPHRPRGSATDRRGCFKCTVALASVMGLVIVALLAGFILHSSMFPRQSCIQDSGPSNDNRPPSAAKFNTTCKPKKSDEQGRYDIFTVTKTATYLIYGEVKNVTSEEVKLMQTRNNINRTIQKKKKSEGEIIFLDKVQLSSGTKISIYFESTHPDSCRFLVYEL